MMCYYLNVQFQAQRVKYGMCSTVYGTALHDPISYLFVCHPNNKKYPRHLDIYKLFEVIEIIFRRQCSPSLY